MHASIHNLGKMRHSSPYLVLNFGVINVLSLRMTKQSLLKSRSPFLLQIPLESLNCTPARAHHNHKCAFCAGHLGGGEQQAIVNMCGQEMYAHATRRLHGPWPRTEVDKE